MRKLTTIALLVSASIWSTPVLFANHPVLVEGNCDSPVPGTTQLPVAAASPSGGGVGTGICGDYDGDGRIGAAEDTDGADRIFGTINAALGPGTGAAAGTGANFNGTITIVKSGRFAEVIVIPQTNGAPTPAPTAAVTIEAAPGVSAAIDAVLQGDPAGGGNTRQASVGITVDAPATAKVILRNLSIRNFLEGVRATNNSRVFIENCVIEHNRDFGLRAMNSSRMHVTGSTITGTGFRVPVTGPSTPGNGIQYEGSARGAVEKSSIVGSFGFGLSNQTGSPVIFYELMYGDNGNGMSTGAVQRFEF